MNKISLFLQDAIPKALHLEELFQGIKEKPWNTRSYINELFVQVGQLTNILYKETTVTEKGRSFDTIGDELSDILLSLIYLVCSQNLAYANMETFLSEKATNVEDLIILSSQISETYMEMVGERFKKLHEGKTAEEFFHDRVLLMIIVCFNMAEKYNIPLSKEFNDMCDRAEQFVLKKQKEIEMLSHNKMEESKHGIS